MKRVEMNEVGAFTKKFTKGITLSVWAAMYVLALFALHKIELFL